MSDLSSLFSDLAIDVANEKEPDCMSERVIEPCVEPSLESVEPCVDPSVEPFDLDEKIAEQCNAALLLEHLVEVFRTEKTGKNIEHILHDRLKNSGLEVIYQPNGTQNSPDFDIKLSGTRTISIECKSSKGKFPVWNGGLPRNKNKYIYIFHQYERLIYIFMAHHLLSEEHEARLITHHEEMLKAATVFNEGFPTSPFKYYPRAMYNQVISFDKEKRDEWFNDCVSYITE